MKEKHYKFSIDEKRPDIPAAPSFAKVLSRVKAKTPWYAKAPFWGGLTTVAAIGTLSFWYLSNPTEDSQPLVSPISVVQSPLSETPAMAPEMVVSEKTETDFHKTGTVFEKLATTYSEKVSEAEAHAVPFPEMTAKLQSPSGPRAVPDYWWSIRLPFDTIKIDINDLPKTLVLGKQSYLMLPSLPFTNQKGQVVSGQITILYREISDAGSMIAAGSFMDKHHGNTGESLENNGSFEFHFLQNGNELNVNPKAPLLFSFKTLNSSASYAGFRSNSTQTTWNAMMQDAYPQGQTALAATQTVTDSLPRKRNLWEWLADVFRGRKIRWDEYERPVSGSDISTTERPLYKTFEIVESGLYASAKFVQAGYGKQRDFRLYTSQGDVLGNVVYQVFINHNIVQSHVMDENGQVQVNFRTSDRCILLVPLSNSPYFAVLDALNFESLVKNGSTDRILLKTDGAAIKTAADLNQLVLRYSGQKLGK